MPSPCIRSHSWPQRGVGSEFGRNRGESRRQTSRPSPLEMENAVTLNADIATANRARAADNGVTSLNDSTGLDNMKQLIQLRWIAVVGQIATIAVVHFGFKISLPLPQMSVLLICLVAFK